MVLRLAARPIASVMLAFEAWFGLRPEITPGLLQAVAATF